MDRTGSPLTQLRMTARNLARQPLRTVLTALGVAVGVIAIIAFSTMVRGLWDAVEQTVHLDNADLLVFQAGVAADIFSLLDEDETRAQLTALPEVTSAVGALWHILPVEKQPFCLMLGLRLEDMDPEWEYLVRGRNPAAEDEIELGTIAQRMLGKDLGDTVLIQGEPYRAVGIFQTGVVFFNSAIVMPLPQLQRLAGKEGRVTVFQVRLRPGTDPAAVVTQIECDHPELAAVSSASQYRKVDQTLEIAQGTIWAISLLAVVIGSLVILNTMWMTVLERTREIGILRAVGWSRRRIVGMVLLEAAGVGLIGYALGCPLGVGLAELMTMLPGSQQFVDPMYDAGPFLLALGIAVLLSVLGALLPAWRAARISPAEALRYE
jgi:putative ABC transport system permease protein